jgi:hypothetical protein
MKVDVEPSSYRAMQQLLQLCTLNVTGATTTCGKEGTSLCILKQDSEPSIANSLLIFFFYWAPQIQNIIPKIH